MSLMYIYPRLICIKKRPPQESDLLYTYGAVTEITDLTRDLNIRPESHAPYDVIYTV